MTISKPVIYIISDSLGETAEFVARAAAIQYNGAGVEFRRIPYVSDPDHLREVIEEASLYNSLIAYTLVVEDLKTVLEEEAKKEICPPLIF